MTAEPAFDRPTAPQGRPPVPGAGAALAPLGGDARSAASAVLRWRAWWLGHHLAGRLVDACRIFPVLLHASFPVRGLSGDAPGIPGLRFRRRWSILARAVGLPPPHRMQRERPLVEAVLGIPSPGGLDTAVLVPAGLRPEELAAVQERMEAAQIALAAAGAPVRTGLFPPSRLAADAEAAQRILAFGGLLAGGLSADAWRALEEGSGRAGNARLVATLAASAPTALSTLALTLLSLHDCPGPLPAMLASLIEGEPARRLADPDVFAVRWASRVPALRGALEETLRLVRRQGPPDASDLGAVLQLGHSLAGACSRAIRRTRGPIDRFTKRLWQEALGPGMPRVLLPAVGDRLRILKGSGRLGIEPVRVGRTYQVRLGDGTVMGRGRGPVQARVRALGLCARALAAAGDEAGAAESLAHLDPTWRVLARRLARPGERGGLVLVVEAGGGSGPGPPFDLLNRGPERAMEFEGAVAVWLAPGRRPSARMLGQAETVETILRRSQGGAPVEVVASRAESRPVATRLAQIAALLGDPTVEGPVAVEAGGLVYASFPPGFRRYRLDRFAARPRRFTADPDAPDLGSAPGDRQRRARPGSGTLACGVSLSARLDAALIYADGDRGSLREVVPLPELEEHLRETRAIAAAARPPAVLVVRHGGEVEPEIRLVGQLRRSVSVVVGGDLPWVEVDVGGERFGGRRALGWDAAAEKVLSLWPPGEPVRLGVNSVTATVRGQPASPLLALWAASVARRRLRARLARHHSAYRRPAAGRNAR